MMATYEKYIYNFGYTKLPLYKTHWYEKKEKNIVRIYTQANWYIIITSIVDLKGKKEYIAA
jgi:hypothetical protein